MYTSRGGGFLVLFCFRSSYCFLQCLREPNRTARTEPTWPDKKWFSLFLEFFVFWFVVSCKGPVKYKKWWGLTLCQFWPLTSANFVLSCLLLVLGMQVPGEQNNFGKPLMSRISRITALRFRRVSGGPRPKLYQSPFLLLFLTDHPNYIYIYRHSIYHFFSYILLTLYVIFFTPPV